LLIVNEVANFVNFYHLNISIDSWLKYIEKGDIMIKILVLIIGMIAMQIPAASKNASKSIYPGARQRIKSPGNTQYYIDAKKGKDSNDGLSPKKAWRTFVPLNKLELQIGDRVDIMPGAYHETLMPMGAGVAKRPIRISFAPGRYDFYPDKQLKKTFNISNTNDDPKGLKAIAIYISDSKHLQIVGKGADLYMRGKMMELVIENSQNIAVNGLAFDYHRPTVSEIRIDKVTDKYIDITVHKDSTYRIENEKKLIWVGEGWTETGGLVQTVDMEKRQVWRGGENPFKEVIRIEEIVPGKLRLYRNERAKIKPGLVFQFRNPHRDYCAFFLNRSKNIIFKDVWIYFMHGMGVVSQFSENLTFDNVKIAPREGAGRIGSAWADMLHFSGCRGKILVKNVHFSGAQDDAINIHGTHLQIVGRVSDDQIKVRFMHRQTNGFLPFIKNDEIEFIRYDTLLPVGENVVKNVEILNNREFILTLKSSPPQDINANDVVENVTWTPDVEVRDCKVEMIPTRGFLLTTRGKVLIENNRFLRTSMSAILIADDARSWFESGYVRDITIKNNYFVHCREPVIRIHPENKKKKGPVHKNIRIINNIFELSAHTPVAAKSTEGLTFTGNTIKSSKNNIQEQELVQQDACSNVVIKNNKNANVK
jgi:hypothetical protein